MLYALRSLSGYAGSESVHICEQSRTRVAALAKAWCWWEGNRDPIQGSAGGLELDTWASDVKRRDRCRRRDAGLHGRPCTITPVNSRSFLLRQLCSSGGQGAQAR